MAIAFRSVHNAVCESGTGSTSPYNLVVDKPTGAVDGDLLVVAFYHDDSTVTTVPDGWTQIASIENTRAAVHFFIRAYWKRASSEPATWTWSITTASWYAWVSAAYTGGLASGDALDGTPTTYANTIADSSTIPLPAVTTTVDGSMLVAIGGNYDGVVTNSGTAPVTNERADGSGLTLYDGVKASAGSSGTITLTVNSSTSVAGILFALKPAATGVTLTVADSSHAHSAEAPTLTQAHSLTVADSTHATSSDNVTLGAVALTATQVGANIRLAWTV